MGLNELIMYMYNLKRTIFGAALCGAMIVSISASAQQTVPTPQLPPDPPKNWHQLDLAKDGYFGISLNQAYDFIKGKKSKTVLVATIDSGCDTLQQDLQGIIWVNPKEVPGNGKDDDGDGYVDDVGCNFLLGGAAYLYFAAKVNTLGETIIG